MTHDDDTSGESHEGLFQQSQGAQIEIVRGSISEFVKSQQGLLNEVMAVLH